jgi:DNA-binding winged helix-turn-helix (wHTH) protein
VLSRSGGDVRHRFGEFTLDENTRELLLHGTQVHLSPKAFELLLLLVANRARALSKAELQQRLWPGTYVEENNLAGLIVQLRRALHDPADEPKFIRTVYGFGYQFVGEHKTGRAPTTTRDPRFSLTFQDRECTLAAGPNVVGRSADAAIRIDAPGVSRRHAQITVSGEQAVLEDLGSKNGTILNGHQIAGVSPLADGDRIQFGAVQATFHAGADLSATATLTAGAE